MEANSFNSSFLSHQRHVNRCFEQNFRRKELPERRVSGFPFDLEEICILIGSRESLTKTHLSNGMEKRTFRYYPSDKIVYLDY